MWYQAGIWRFRDLESLRGAKVRLNFLAACRIAIKGHGTGFPFLVGLLEGRSDVKKVFIPEVLVIPSLFILLIIASRTYAHVRRVGDRLR